MAVLRQEPERPVTTTTSRRALTGSPSGWSELLILFADEAKQLGAVRDTDQLVAKGAVLEQTRHARQRFQVLADRVFRRDQQKEEMRRTAIERVEVDAGHMTPERADDPLQSGQLAVRNG